MTYVLFLASLAMSSPEAPVRSEPHVSSPLVCAAQNAVRGKRPTWSVDLCRRLAFVLNGTARPRTLLAMAVIESDLTVRALSPMKRKAGGERVRDVGLLGIRCLLDQQGRCRNFPVGKEFLSIQELFYPEVNVLLANHLIRRKIAACGSHWPDCYNGNPSGSNHYGEQISVLSAALVGRKAPGGSARVRQLAKRLLALFGT
jgi:hypothetical protein